MKNPIRRHSRFKGINFVKNTIPAQRYHFLALLSANSRSKTKPKSEEPSNASQVMPSPKTPVVCTAEQEQTRNGGIIQSQKWKPKEEQEVRAQKEERYVPEINKIPRNKAV